MLFCSYVNESKVIPARFMIDPFRRFRERWRHDLVFFAIAASIIGADQLTKWLVRDNLALYEQWPEQSILGMRIIHVVNSGAAFGILQGQTSFLIVTSLFGLAAITLYYFYPPMEHRLIRIALGMQLGGATGNLIDRVRMGEVTDFIDVGRFPTWNIADASITVSIVAVLLFFALEEVHGDRRERQPADHGHEPVHDERTDG